MKRFVRVYAKKLEETEIKPHKDKPYVDYNRVFVFDIETTADEFQNMKFGFFQIYEGGQLVHQGLINEATNNTVDENKILIDYAEKNILELYSRDEFVEKIFYEELINRESLCIGYNLPFDLSRVAIKFSPGRKNKNGRNNRNAFVLTLSDDSYKPQIRITHIDGSMSFIGFSSNRAKSSFKGRFLDLKTLATIFSQIKHITLDKACDKYNKTYKKLKVKKHGKITPKYILYNITDVKATHELYTHLLAKYKQYQLDLDIIQVYSEASLGKQFLRQLGIKPFMVQNPSFPPDIIGNLMNAYYGGWTECMKRKVFLPVTVLDFKSMYPSVYVLMGLHRYVIANTITTKDTTVETTELLGRLNINQLFTKDIWKTLNTLVKIKPNSDLLPFRTRYGDEDIPTTGVNYITSNRYVWYPLPDIIGTVIHTGKIPEIVQAITFIPNGVQSSLKTTKILDQEFDPTNDFIKQIVELRQKYSDEGLKAKAKSMKIIASATSYGIFIEMNTTGETAMVKVYSDGVFDSEMEDFEEAGEFYNPIISVIQTSGARLLMHMAQVKLRDMGGEHAYMDTDSIFVPPKYASTLVDLFQALNPYEFNAPFLKIDKKNKLFYGISSKRYCLHTIKGKNIVISKDDFKLHGLGHLTNPFLNKKVHWHKEVWKDILSIEYDLSKSGDIGQKYSSFHPIAKQAITTPRILDMLRKVNKGKPLKEQIKPFNFILVGQSTDKKNVKIIAKFSKNPQEAVHQPFINGKNGEVMQGEEHWITLDKTIFDYLNHPESKFENGNETGNMKRRKITETDTRYIGKEVKNLENEFLLPQTPTELKKSKKQPLTDQEMKRKGWSRQRRAYWKNKPK